MFENNIKKIYTNELNWIAEFEESNIEYLEEENIFINKLDNEILKFEKNEDYKNYINFYKDQFIFIFGIMDIELIKYTVKNKTKNTKVVIFEPNSTFFSYALSFYDLTFFNNNNVFIFQDKNKGNLLPFIDGLLLSYESVVLIKEIEIIFNGYYSRYDLNIIKEFIKEIKQIISTRIQSFGNSLEDSIIGLNQNLINIEQLKKSLDVSKIKDLYKDKPAILVSAGPSLNKNMHHLKKVKGKALIIAVDTIASRLIKEGIIPDFICSIERGVETYNYFYKEKNYPEEVTLVGPLLLHPDIFKEFKGDIIIPFRKVAEYTWLESMTRITDNYFDIGMSCAHVGFGLAAYLGCSPIILTGQDLAYGENYNQTHAVGTVYDKKDDLLEKGLKKHLEQGIYIDGYYGGEVYSNNVWMQFKKAFEQMIVNNNLSVINATEGGAKIHHTVNYSLEEAIIKFCSYKIENFKSISSEIEKYKLNMDEFNEKIKVELVFFRNLRELALQYISNLEKLDLKLLLASNKYSKIEKIINESKVLTDNILAHPLLKHNLQSTLLNGEWQLNTVEKSLDYENLLKIRGIKQKILWSIVAALSEIDDTLKTYLDSKKEG